MSGPRSAAALFLAVLAGSAHAYQGPDRYGLYSARLDGSDRHAILTSPDQQMTHPRVSPDGKWITFTRYHRKVRGAAREENGYRETSIEIVRLDGSGARTVVPPRRGLIAANSSFTPDGGGLVFLTTDTPGQRPQLHRIDLASGRMARLPTPPELQVADPHWVGDLVAFTQVGGEGVNTVWGMHADGSGAAPLSHPRMAPDRKGSRHDPGDYDPRIAPDATRVVCMRHFGAEEWRIVMLDRATGTERDLSAPGVTESLPDWSGDGQLLIFTVIDRARPQRIGLHVMRPDGTQRRQLPLPRGYVYFHASFVPGDGSAPAARIVFAATRNPKVP